MKIIAKIEFTSLSGSTYTGNLKTNRPFEGGVHTFQLPESPISISMIGQKNTETPIKPSQLQLRVINEDAFQALDFLAYSNRSHVFELFRDKTQIWSGFMIPDQWKEPFVHTPYITTFTFVDGLSLLKDEQFTDETGCYLRGRWKMWRVIDLCLKRINGRGRSLVLQRDMVDQINIVEKRAGEPHEGTMYQKYIDIETFRGMNCWEVLASVLKSFTARIELNTWNEYVISRINDERETVHSNHYRWAQSGGLLMWQTTAKKLSKITKGKSDPDMVCWIDKSQMLERLPGWKEFTLKQDYGRKKSMLPRSGFEPCDWQDKFNLKGWRTNGVMKSRQYGEDCLMMLPSQVYTGRIRRQTINIPNEWAYDPPSYIEVYSGDEYSNANVPDDDQDIIVLEIDCANSERYPITPYMAEETTYHGPRTTTGGTTPRESNRKVSSSAGNYDVLALEKVKAYKGGDYGSVFFPVDNEGNFKEPSNLVLGWKDDGGAIHYDNLTGGDVDESLVSPRYVIFPNANEVPIDEDGNKFKAGVPYKIVAYDPWLDFSFFLAEAVEDKEITTDDHITIHDDSAYKLYNCKFGINAIPVQLGLVPNPPYYHRHSIDYKGEWMQRAQLFLELDKSDFENGSFFITGTKAVETPRYAHDGDYEEIIQGQVRLLIEKPIPREARQVTQGGFMIESVRVFLDGVPEGREDVIKLNQDNNLTGEVNIMFAETPIKGNFLNNKLKFFNNFYSVDIDREPGAQGVYLPDGRFLDGDEVQTTSDSPTRQGTTTQSKIVQTLRKIIIDFYTGLYKYPRLQLSGRLKTSGKQIMNDTIYEAHTNRRYRITSCEWDVKHDEFNVTLHEIIKEEQAEPFETHQYNKKHYKETHYK